ncbi:HipA domain-containing protein [Cellulophaga sp. HaHaR_3_176]|uniref:type II toxin-antitoxin system HipA family toxin n=1 Tax=Cellulophaga sp. HaHaR_3_176 TaxID=1942464 RepID=UPI001C1FDB47|nr:HipA domain-containing protein [Cellulophaga sp. HaHaR_3_176]QWX83565.1 HipA domain-containing protein [Cellulophaga sp. HaHaR_3_176]
MKRTIYVYADWLELNSPVLIGELYSETLRGKEVFSFAYQKEWLQSDYAYQLDPDLGLFEGIQYLNDEKSNFGLFLDSSPDRWGRVLMKRREAALARKEERKTVKLFETDFLLGVFDGHRMGALRFKLDKEGSFLNDNKELASPPWTSIRELEQISLRLEDDNSLDDPDYLKWLQMLVSPGSSLGGARPKAGVLDNEGNLWIAKFPSKNDGDDVGGWEMVTYQLAIQSGIKMAESKAEKFNSNQHTFLTKRFDRTIDGKRIHFASAMTLLGYTDGVDASNGVSYLELVDFISKHGAHPEDDLKQLWRRIIFSICVSNTDDHLRNHGFLLTEKGWVLSPAYDINPVETGMGLKLNISEDDNALDLDLALTVAPYFRIEKETGQIIIDEISHIVSTWKVIANKYGLSRREQELKASAFKRAVN